jgi:hypothetical protein
MRKSIPPYPPKLERWLVETSRGGDSGPRIDGARGLRPARDGTERAPFDLRSLRRSTPLGTIR